MKWLWNIAKNPKYDGYQFGIALMVCKYFGKTSAALRANKSSSANTSSGANEIEFILHWQLADELHKQIIRKLEKWRVYSSF